ncbi:GNAT family N-acetyltransferase [Proteus cibi]|uniref:GNAT family N-acetyltransferase n=1 Tax=Proteus cibi TaxID=2050966 RepID=A0ABU6EGF1_9GAMM|nr:GNAT family N-acetyltransferase [Proteus cibi]MEB6858157.1 GNAT family N-acetyltransferase [Proteus cibi]MEB7089554.1 GNAT family N-acetyltransferase [Proteus cibi]
MTLKLTAPEPLKIGHLLESFSSDEEALDLWLKNRAISNQNSGTSRTFVTTSDNQVMGYYALSTGVISTNQAVGRFRHNMPTDIPIILLGRLAVDTRAKGLGIRRGLVKDACHRVIQASGLVGIRGVVVHALTDNAKRFYEHIGFVPSPLDPMMLMVTLADLQLAMGIHSN